MLNWLVNLIINYKYFYRNITEDQPVNIMNCYSVNHINIDKLNKTSKIYIAFLCKIWGLN